MKISKSILTISIIVVAIFTALLLSKTSKPAQSRGILVSRGGPVLLAITNDEGGVEVTATPILRKEGTLDFEISLETHSVELSNDLTSDSVLIDEAGRTYSPSSWEGDPTGGHHRSGILRFNESLPGSKLNLVIKNVGGVPERSFKWKME